MPEAALLTKNLRKDIGSKTIVSDINLNIHTGEVFGFLGPNGAGKTTTIRMIVGLSRITQGDIFINGHSVRTAFREAMCDVGCIVENPELYKYMSGLDNLRMFARLYAGITQARIDEVVKLVHLEDAIRGKVKTYSLGMRQRLGIAQALLHRPRLLILDEPTNGLDPAGIREMRGLFRSLAEQGTTVFVSSHILAEMQQMCDRVGIIHHGRMVTVKTVDELVDMSHSGGVQLLVRTGDNGKALACITELNIQAGMEKDGVRVSTEPARVPEIVRALVGAQIDVFALDTQEAHSLEDVFIKLTGEEQQNG
ncbi:ABC transporter ATP-binding protein [Ethanoligenens harbinense]|uniref:ABC transporter related protein n=1 Tax=Ethanoligenens harbinense (strain DSM 18485 / JCM 12961 / CGMCC 1.5033 / YUAN-3) TaxID=663278 RepID=E6U9I5_ETHHY|nr:ABC transporter ATP-binding protein [Ethanoligenens harbinense]ADU26176.1 ABC transporter related protein [Ethanoligenens harbinense YUAN-3]AVQ95314.1 ABC transporter ATP-binding protein [Ethanoligenens harbinense YUAN-3]AYF37979.1 ABC transporter ATP-binding protein [Ethanoligenens harbinense]AYF40725.1 ABC transporter ATP-binding protein [Ethanoligenens harbinense]QCN91558.1 ABC transporter ATP-binding protein [Ethanoligenens harbinense]